jgi:hypothetical protein
MAALKPVTIEDISRSYSKAIKQMSRPYKSTLSHAPAMRGQQVPPGMYRQPPGAPSVAFNVSLRGR